MYEIKPNLNLSFTCPECNCRDVEIAGIVFPGIRILADCLCHCCDNSFFADLPAGHALYYPKIVMKKTGKVYPAEGKLNWFSRQLMESYRDKKIPFDVNVEKIKFIDPGKEVILLNCLDYLYGHVLLKLFNAEGYIKNVPAKPLILLLPKSFQWLIPAGIAEVWLVDLKLAELKKWLQGLDEFVHHELTRFDKVFLSPGFSHPDTNQFNINDYSKISPFDLTQFSKTKPVITFIYREDRLWHSYAWEEYLFNIACTIEGLKITRTLFIRLQNRKIEKFFKKINKEFPEVTCMVVGLGKRGSFDKKIIDKRVTSINQETESAWCEMYALSHLVIGIHGSNMLLPSAHAAGFIELLPDSRIHNMTQDIVPRHEGKFLLFMARHVRSKLNPGKVAKLAIAMIRDFPVFELYNSKDFVRYDQIQKIQEYSSEYKSRSSWI